MRHFGIDQIVRLASLVLVVVECQENRWTPNQAGNQPQNHWNLDTGRQNSPSDNAECYVHSNQFFCEKPGPDYPIDKIESFISDNVALSRRMYGENDAETLDLTAQELAIDVPQLLQPAEFPAVHSEQPPIKYGVPKVPKSTTDFTTESSFGLMPPLVTSRHTMPWPGQKHIYDQGFRSSSQGYLPPRQEGMSSTPQQRSISYGHFVHTRHKRDLTSSSETVYAASENDNPNSSSRNNSANGYGYFPKQDDNMIDSCTSQSRTLTPFWVHNIKGQLRAIVNSRHFPQTVHMETCNVKTTAYCHGTCSCGQKYHLHRLLAYDPNNECSGIFVDIFVFPSACVCRCPRQD